MLQLVAPYFSNGYCSATDKRNIYLNAPKVWKKCALQFDRKNHFMYVTYPMNCFTFIKSHVKWNCSYPDFVFGFFMKGSFMLAKYFLQWYPPFSNFSCMFLNPNSFFQIWILIVLIYWFWETSRSKLRKHSVTKKCSVWINCSSDLKICANPRSLDFFFLLTVQFW